jgi:hypothetical protein
VEARELFGWRKRTAELGYSSGLESFAFRPLSSDSVRWQRHQQ